MTFNTLSTPPTMLRAPSGSDVVAGGVRVHYQRWGDHGSPIVLVHGFAESTVSWAATASVLSRDHVVVALDLPGYGYSQHTGHYTLEDQAQNVLALDAALHLQRPTLIGHSLGAAVVGEVARRAPGAVSGVIFADGDAMPVGGNGKARGAMSLIMRTPYATTLYRVLTHWNWLDSRIVREECGTHCRAYSPELVRAWMRPMRQGAAETALTDMAGQGMLAMTPQGVRSIRVPRGIIWGAQDASGGGSLAGAQSDLGHPRTVVLADAGHLSMVADPAGFATGVRTIMSGWKN